MSGPKVVFLAVLVGALASLSGQEVLFRLTDVLVATVVLCGAWSWLSVRGMRLDRNLRQDRAQVGGVAEQRLDLRSRIPIPRVWIEFVDGGTFPGYRAGRVVDFGWRGRRAWAIEAPCRRRGLFEFGPATISGSDPFGLFRSSRRLGSVRSILVYPRTVDLTGLSLPAGQFLGGDRRRAGWHQTTSHVSGIRDYRPGDSVRHVHWRSTAHARQLMVKEFDVEPIADVWIFLDLETSVQRGSGDESTEEYGVTIAASLARHFLTQGRSVGLVAIASEHRILPADRGQRQLTKLLEDLAVVHADGSVPIAEVLASECDRVTRNAAVIVVTPSLDERWPSILRGLRDRGIETAAVVLEAATFGDADSSLLLVGTLATCAVPSALVKRGDDISQALTLSSGRGLGSAAERVGRG
jgi:uncharacterized protein (DUF58 family)